MNRLQIQRAELAGLPHRRGAVGKALLVWLFSGSIGLALIAYLIFAGAGC